MRSPVKTLSSIQERTHAIEVEEAKRANLRSLTLAKARAPRMSGLLHLEGIYRLRHGGSRVSMQAPITSLLLIPHLEWEDRRGALGPLSEFQATTT